MENDRKQEAYPEIKKIGQIALKFAKKQPYFCTCVRFALPYSCIFDMNEGGIL